MAAQYAELSDEQLVHRVFSTERELIQARFRHSTNQLENSAHLRVLRKEIARLKTEARRREIAQGLAKDLLIHTHRQTFAPTAVEAGTTEEAKGGFLSGIVDKLSGKD